MEKVIISALVAVLMLSGCGKLLNTKADPIYTYDGFYSGLDLSREEQEIVDNKMLHISQAYLAPTAAYSLSDYPMPDVVENDYLKYHEEEINEYLEQKFSELVYGVVEIDIREDMIYDYQEIPQEDGSIEGYLTYAYEIIGYEEAEGPFNIVKVDTELLKTLNKRDEFKPELFSPHREFGWYDEFTVIDILVMYYNDQITKYYSEMVGEINDYLDSTGRYYDKQRLDTCPYYGYINECAYTGDVNIGIGFSEERNAIIARDGFSEEFLEDYDALRFYFAENDMSVPEIIEYVEASDDYAFGIRVAPFLSYERYMEGNLNNLDNDFEPIMRAFTDANLEWIIEDKDQVKAIINKSDITYNYVTFKVGFGYQLSSDETEYDSFGGKSIYFQMVRIYNEDYPWLTEDIDRTGRFGAAAEFKWKGNK